MSYVGETRAKLLLCSAASVKCTHMALLSGTGMSLLELKGLMFFSEVKFLCKLILIRNLKAFF